MNTAAAHRAASTITLAATAAFCLAIAAPAAHAQVVAQTHTGATVSVKDWDVYVDLPTRFAFVKTPKGWVFVRQLDEEQMTRLPATTLTWLLPPDDGETRYAHPALEPSPRVQAQRRSETRQAGITAPAAAARQ